MLARRPVLSGLVLTFALLVLPVPGFAQSPNCPAANPNDWLPDDEAINDCTYYQSAVYLEPGSPGYILTDRIRIREWTTEFAGVGGKAKLLAAPALTSMMVEVQGANYYSMYELIVDGNNSNRTRKDLCFGGSFAGAYGANVLASGVGYVIHHVDTVNAMCGSGLEARGNNFEIYSVYAAFNGDEAPNGPWSDGITLTRCDGGYVHNNYIADNTDIGLVFFKGIGCTVRSNTIEQNTRYAFAAAQVGNTGDETISLAGSVFKDNQIYAGENLASFGLLVGTHPWTTGGAITSAGEVSYNTIVGAMANLVVDGIQDGWVHSNTMSNARGTRAYTCTYTSNYTAHHFGSASIQGGYTVHAFDPGC